MCKDFILTTDELFGSYCYIEQKRYGVPNEKFLYKIIGKFTSNAWSNVPVDANDKEPHIFNHSEEVVNVVCCGVCEDKIERYKLSDVEIISNKDQQLANLEAKLAESEKQIKDAREAGNMAVDSWCKNRRKYEAQIAEMQNKSFILYSMLYETLEKQGCDNVASQIDQMTGWTYDKEADWLKGNRNYDQLKQQLAEKETRIAELEEQLKNATHKFSIGEEVYYLGYNYKFEPYVSKYLTVCKGKILDIILREGGYVEYNFTFDDLKWIAEENCFLTKKEAEAKLKELTAKNV